MAEADRDYTEVSGTSASIASGGGTGNLDIVLTDLPPGRSIVRIHELVFDSLSIDFDAALHEDDARLTLNRVVNIENINLHTVQLLGAGRGMQYTDRDVATETDQAELNFAFVNNDVANRTITARVRYSVYFAR